MSSPKRRSTFAFRDASMHALQKSTAAFAARSKLIPEASLPTNAEDRQSPAPCI